MIGLSKTSKINQSIFFSLILASSPKSPKGKGAQSPRQRKAKRAAGDD